MTIGVSIRERRETAGLSLRSLARRIGVDAAYLSRVEQGAVPPSEQLVRALAPHLGLGLDEMLLLAGRLPESLQRFVELEPERVTAALTGLAAMCIAEPRSVYGGPMLGGRGRRAIEDGFPFAELSAVAEVESWRKEIYRPIYHLHKWWAQRLGSVFRAVILGATAPQGSALMDLFYQPVRLPAPVVFDPFMGSGTTVGEAHKLGCTVIGRDINPVACRAVRVALAPLSRDRLETLYSSLERTVGAKLRALYRSTDGDGEPCDVLYYFWVKTLPCPDCSTRVDLFSTYVIGRHAYVRRNPRVQVLCPECGDVFAGEHSDEEVACTGCGHRFDPHRGSVDLIVTDPPFFDNVHYSELADFFHVWQKIYFDGEAPSPEHTTRQPEEVQDKDAGTFASKLERVLFECHRVLRDDGLMVFSYHHSRDDGWLAVAQAVWRAGFRFVAAQPVKAEMSVAKPKARARSPIDLDVLTVCRKRRNRADAGSPAEVMRSAVPAARQRVAAFNRAGRLLSESDVRVILHSQLLVECSQNPPDRALGVLTELLAATAAPAAAMWRDQDVAPTSVADAGARQLELVL